MNAEKSSHHPKSRRTPVKQSFTRCFGNGLLARQTLKEDCLRRMKNARQHQIDVRRQETSHFGTVLEDHHQLMTDVEATLHTTEQHVEELLNEQEYMDLLEELTSEWKDLLDSLMLEEQLEFE